jgi:alpha 1,2-mannosyltransferase
MVEALAMFVIGFLWVAALFVSTIKAIDSERANAVIVILARNSDFNGLNRSLTQFEARFNSKFQYPYVFLNDAPFTEQFKTGVKAFISTKAEFGTIPQEHWSYPSWINVTKADAARADMHNRKVIYGGSLPYRHMCRYNSGFFFRHPLLQQYDYYWRVEPSVDFTCDIDYDPFVFLKKSGKEYGFTVALSEYKQTIRTLWNTTQQFIQANPSLLHPQNVLKSFLTKDDGTYNLCHFWSNFEIASLKLWRSEAYLKYFEFLDAAGGFFYERWGDAPVHSIAAAMFLPKEKIHFFDDIGYFHAPFQNCPAKAKQLKCSCAPESSFNLNSGCHAKFSNLFEKDSKQ